MIARIYTHTQLVIMLLHLQVPSVCSCTDNTNGRNCEKCLPLYNDSPWRSGFDNTYKGCPNSKTLPYMVTLFYSAIECNCNNRTDSCRNIATTSNGICMNCTDHTAGSSCQFCDTGYYQVDDACLGMKVLLSLL